MNFNGYELALIDEAGYNGIQDKHIEIVAEAIKNSGLSEIDNSSFKKICYSCGIDSDNFTAFDIEVLKQRLNG